MGNTKTYYIEGELKPGMTLQQFKEAVHDGFHSTYCVAEIVEQSGGYLGAGPSDEGPYVVAAIHSYSMRGDHGPAHIAPLFNSFRMHRLDSDWSDIWAIAGDKSQIFEWRSQAPLDWKPMPETAHVSPKSHDSPEAKE